MVSNKVERDAIAKINSQILELKWRVAALRFTLLLKRYDPNQPRVAAGRPDGGQWTDTGTQSAAIMNSNAGAMSSMLATPSTARWSDCVPVTLRQWPDTGTAFKAARYAL